MALLASDFDQSRFLRGEGYGERGKKFRTRAVTSEELKNRKTGAPEKKLIVWFTNSTQGLICNAGNRRTFQGAFGDDTAGWINKIVIIYPVMTELGPGLRVRIPPPKQPEAAPAAPQQPVAAGNGAPATPVAPAAPQQAAAAGNGAAVPLAVAAAVPLAVGTAMAAQAAAVDPELEPDPVELTGEEMDDEVAY